MAILLVRYLNGCTTAIWLVKLSHGLAIAIRIVGYFHGCVMAIWLLKYVNGFLMAIWLFRYFLGCAMVIWLLKYLNGSLRVICLLDIFILCNGNLTIELFYWQSNGHMVGWIFSYLCNGCPPPSPLLEYRTIEQSLPPIIRADHRICHMNWHFKE